MTMAEKRIRRELVTFVRQINNSDWPCLFHVIPENNLLDITGFIMGPRDSPFENGIFRLEIKIPQNYPFYPPKVKFLTHIWHPNISSVNGTICLDILKDHWAASLTLRTLLLNIQALLSVPEVDDPQDTMVARQYKNNREQYYETARFWTYYYAMDKDQQMPYVPFYAPKLEIIRKARQASNGSVDEVVRSLSLNNWNVPAPK